jgi:predicted GNAT family N-acyltransferase
MIGLLYIALGVGISYSIFRLLMEVFNELKSSKHTNIDDRDTDERRIAGEETSEVALNYLKIASETKDLP